MAQFVPLKIDTATPQWSQWASKYPHEGSGIPILYVIRADEQMLYGKTGSLPGDQLTQFLVQHLAMAGKVCTPVQAKTISDAVSNAKKALEQDDPATAIASLLPLKKLGTLGQLGSYAAPALESDQLIKQLTEAAREQLTSAERLLAETKEPVPILLQFVETCRTYAQLPTVKAEIKLTRRKLERNSQLRSLLREAEALDRARVLAKTPRNRARAQSALEKLIANDPDSAVAALAEADLQVLLANSTRDQKTTSETRAVSEPQLRIWTDATGTYTVRATLLEVDGAQVVLRRADGKIIRVPIEKLSDGDRRLVERRK